MSHELPVFAVAVFVPLSSQGGMIPVTLQGPGRHGALHVLFSGILRAPIGLPSPLALACRAVTFVASLPRGVVHAPQGTPWESPSRAAAGSAR